MSATPEVKKRVSEASKVREWAVKEITDLNLKVIAVKDEVMNHVQSLTETVKELIKGMDAEPVVHETDTEEEPDLHCSEDSSSEEEKAPPPIKKRHREAKEGFSAEADQPFVKRGKPHGRLNQKFGK
jgi:hypothetical protein